MKSPQGIMLVMMRYAFIFSVSIHMLILSIPVSMVIKPQIQEMELFVSIEDLRILPESVKMQMENKKPRTEPVKENNRLTEAPQIQIKKPDIIEPVREVMVEQEKEVKKEPVEKIEDKPIRVESYSVNRPAFESREAFFVPTGSKITEGNGHSPPVGGSIGPPIGVGEQSSVSKNMNGGDASNPIETRFGASIAPAFLHREMPRYPMMARRFGKEGKVVVRLTIDENGNLLNVEVLEKAGFGFTEAAVEAVKRSTFLPAKKDGKTIASRALLPIRFQLETD